MLCFKLDILQGRCGKMLYAARFANSGTAVTSVGIQPVPSLTATDLQGLPPPVFGSLGAVTYFRLVGTSVTWKLVRTSRFRLAVIGIYCNFTTGKCFNTCSNFLTMQPMIGTTLRMPT